MYTYVSNVSAKFIFCYFVYVFVAVFIASKHFHINKIEIQICVKSDGDTISG